MKWNVLNQHKLQSTEDKVGKIIHILLENRGIKNKKEIEEFLEPVNPSEFKASDLGIDQKEVDKAVKRINLAIKNNESIIVYGDYDADGICATAILWESLYGLRKNKDDQKLILPYIPERITEGYGLNQDSIKNLKSQNPSLKLIITVDHGITATDKIEYAKSLGIDVIICDHHQLGKKKPRCIAILHTETISAAAISWFLAKEISSTYHFPKDSLLITYLDLVAIATIADLEPLVGINRSFVKYGLEALRKTKRCGLLEIFEEAGIKKEEIDTYHVGYIIAPRLNAMGRMENAMESLRLLCTSNKNQARQLAEKLGLTNKERQELTEETVVQARKSVELITNNEKLLFVTHESFSQGIIGLVAGKLVEQFYKPAIVLSVGEVYSKASARSITGFNIIEAIRMHSDILVDAGGHPMAAGFTVETVKLKELKIRMLKVAQELITDEMLEKKIKVDMELPLLAITGTLWQELKKLSPFGIGNPEPVFTSSVILKDFRTVGAKQNHLKMTVEDKNTRMSAIAFNKGEMSDKLSSNQEIKIAYCITENQWNNEKKLELKIKDIQ